MKKQNKTQYKSSKTYYKNHGRKRKKASLSSFLFSIIIILLIFLAYKMGLIKIVEQKINENTKVVETQTTSLPPKITEEKLEYAHHVDDTLEIPHEYYTIGYDTANRVANWVGYELRAVDLNNPVASRSEDFREDEYAPLPRATLDDYRRSGYDRGHLAPAADFKFNDTAMSETFFLTNMCPQTHEYNAGIWEVLEKVVRKNAKKEGLIYVTTGPYFEGNKDKKTIGANKIPVPDAFYKAILVYNDNVQKSIAFLIPHQKDDSGNITKYAMSVDELESKLQTDFFYNLPDEIEEKIENTYDTKLWIMRENQQ